MNRDESCFAATTIQSYILLHVHFVISNQIVEYLQWDLFAGCPPARQIDK